MKNLDEIIDKSYQIFKKYKAKAPLDVCTECCLTKNQESELVSLSVRHIPFDLLYEYNTAAKTEKPDIEEFKHFLPKFLEYTADIKFLHHSGELVLYRFEYYEKSEWTPEEQQLMQDFGLAYFDKILTNFPLPDFEHIDSVLIMLWKAKIDIEPILDYWTTRTNSESILHFNYLINWSFKANQVDKLSSPFADDELSELIAQWLKNEKTKSRFASMIEAFIMEPPDGTENSVLAQLSWTYEKMKIPAIKN